MISVEDIVAAAVEATADVVHDITAGGPGSGRHKEYYHGTTSRFKDSILQHGLKTKRSGSTITTNRDYAERAAKLSAQEKGGAPIVVVIKESAGKYFKPLENLGPELGNKISDLVSTTYGQRIHSKHIDHIDDIKASSKAIYPDDHKAGMKVPKGGSSCAVCEYLKGPHECGNKYFIQWNGSNKFEPPSDEYCCDWFSPAKGIIKAGGPGSGRHKELLQKVTTTFLRHLNSLPGPKANKDDLSYGHCANWAALVAHVIPEAKLKSGSIGEDGHAFVKIESKYYDASTPNGVEDWKKLKGWPDDVEGKVVIDSHSTASEYKKELPDDYDQKLVNLLIKKLNIKAASEVSLEGDQKGTLWNGILIKGFTGPQEEGLRAMLSRVPPELLGNVKEIVSAPDLNAKHGKYDDATKTVSYNPKNFELKQKFGQGDGGISHPELTVVHEIGHSIYRSLTPEQQTQWEDISGWMLGWKPGQSIAYQEKRPGWGDATSEYTHKAGATFARHYGERNQDEDFADAFAFVLLGKGFQMEPAKKVFIDNYIQEYVKKYPQASIQSPIHAGGPGSGEYIHKKGPEKEKPLSDRAQRALTSYVAQTKGKSRIAKLNELLVAKYVKGQGTPDNKPFDVLTKKVGIEVKTIFPGVKNEKITMHPASLARKVKAQKELGVKPWTVVLDMRSKLDVYIKPALGSFRLGSMQRIESIKALGKYIR